ncbi:sensor domain-containing diguanylate cyclase [Agrobacterium tumefaciens]|uniref:diguanylate cyclase n=1 Tax=Agrobacterium tumefaciens TaxID=358 RepID=A0AA44F739_AGRTU|nr:sensor domain-containing diguanylate cyclase [Agrobacterium tumefaciens]NTB87542.1 sensor domain-containing diguanylate cyclase [Agrobacterium tumefaciens]NTC17527.1 sensor domain-containing diguanylate cyclase [Agrobacterium tumefaciens]NTC29691.1 sensor domain-containing diguanylate cyclase [Agrobacterium tumefaciens]
MTTVNILPMRPIIRPSDQAEFALEVAGQWIWELDFSTNRVWRSQHWKTVLGFSVDEPIDNYVRWGIVDPRDKMIVTEALRALEAGETQLFEAAYRVAGKDGESRWIFSRGKIVDRAKDGKPMRLLAVSMDITNQKRTEEELQRALAESELLRIQLCEANLRLEKLSSLDALTGLPNRRSVDRALSEAIGRQEATSGIVSVLMIDVDRFKDYNDSLGHQAGDDALRAVSVALNDATGAEGQVSRYCGEEFVAILESAGEQEAAEVARRCVMAVRETRIRHPKGINSRVTISIGVATADFREGGYPLSGSALVNAADTALYEAKRAGRDQVGLYVRSLPA